MKYDKITKIKYLFRYPTILYHEKNIYKKIVQQNQYFWVTTYNIILENAQTCAKSSLQVNKPSIHNTLYTAMSAHGIMLEIYWQHPSRVNASRLNTFPKVGRRARIILKNSTSGDLGKIENYEHPLTRSEPMHVSIKTSTSCECLVTCLQCISSVKEST